MEKSGWEEEEVCILHSISCHLQQATWTAGGNFRPLGHSAARKSEQSRGKWQSRSVLMSTTTPPACECVGTLSISFHFVCASQPVLEARVDNVTLTLEERVLPHDCVAGQLWQTVLTNAQCLIQNMLHSCALFLSTNTIHSQARRKAFSFTYWSVYFSCKLLMLLVHRQMTKMTNQVDP